MDVSAEELRAYRERRRAAAPEGGRHAERAEAFGRQMEQLMRGDPWETYRAHVEVLRDRLEEERDLLRARLVEEPLVGDHAQRALLNLQRLAGQLEFAALVLGLPEMLREHVP